MKLFADAHEFGKSGIATQMDFHNNNEGRIIGDNFDSLNLLAIEAAILHEGLHAEIYRYVDENSNDPIDPNDRARLWQLYTSLGAQNGLDLATTDAQHFYMTERYLIPLAEAIQRLDGNRFEIDEYLGFAWEGLGGYGLVGYYDRNGNFQRITQTELGEFSRKKADILNSTTFGNDCE